MISSLKKMVMQYKEPGLCRLLFIEKMLDGALEGLA
jgi:hypothetical protein